MSQTISIPDALYSKAQRLAEDNAQSVDDVIEQLIANSLENPRLSLAKSEQDELAALAYLSDATLFTIVRERMPQSKQDKMQVLMNKNNKGAISNSETADLSQLVDDGQRLMLRKAEALKLLLQRGHQVGLDDMTEDYG